MSIVFYLLYKNYIKFKQIIDTIKIIIKKLRQKQPYVGAVMK